MKQSTFTKMALAVALAASSITSIAAPNDPFAGPAEWTVINETESGTRMMVLRNTFERKLNRTGVDTASGVFGFFQKNAAQVDPFFAGVTIQGCQRRGGPIVIAALSDDEDPTPNTYFWTKGGPKMYDIVGELLCNTAAKRESNSYRSAPTKSNKDSV